MVKRCFFLILIILSFSTCGSLMCDHTGSIVGTGLRSKHLYKKYLKKRIDPNTKGLRTDIVYADLGYSYSEIEDKISYSKEWTSTVNSRGYYRFYKSGNIYSFTFKNQDTILNENSFNPIHGDIGFVIDHKKNIIMDYATVNCGGFFERSFEMQNDTLIMKHGTGGEGNRVLYYYKAIEVPKEWLDYPDDVK